ncbi:MAG: exodeoxyribonuclease V subunit gamma [Bacteroidales bacterium]|nr:exodeoxyribonuclease V subunit gamma [Bacteroidales bacterium]
MNHIYTSPRQEDLCKKLSEKLNEPTGDIFKKEVIITPSAGMNAWLKTELPKRNRIIANFEFQNQDGLFRDICALYYGEKLPASVGNIKYKIFGLLAEDEFVNRFNVVSSYYHNSEIFRFQLAGKIADLFDQYQLCRPQMLQAWKQDELVTTNQAEDWQKWLWNRLGITPKDEIGKDLLDRIRKNPETLQQQYPRISFFGITVYTSFSPGFFRSHCCIHPARFLSLPPCN